eukprot:6010658-Prymnesium_polylepis.1
MSASTSSSSSLRWITLNPRSPTCAQAGRCGRVQAIGCGRARACKREGVDAASRGSGRGGAHASNLLRGGGVGEALKVLVEHLGRPRRFDAFRQPVLLPHAHLHAHTHGPSGVWRCGLADGGCVSRSGGFN